MGLTGKQFPTFMVVSGSWDSFFILTCDRVLCCFCFFFFFFFLFFFFFVFFFHLLIIVESGKTSKSGNSDKLSS